MITFNQYNESFNQPYDFQHHKHVDTLAHQTHEYRFQGHNKTGYNVHITHDKKGHEPAEVSFEDHDGNMHKTGASKENPHKIFSTVKHVIDHHLKQHPHISSIEFSADKQDNNRGTLYRHFAKRFAKHHTEHEDENDHTFTIHKKDLK